MKKILDKQTKNNLAEMLAWMTVNEPEKTKKILSGWAIVPSLDGSGKMSKTGRIKDQIQLTDSLKTIKKKVAKIPSIPACYHVFVGLFWGFITSKERDEVANLAMNKILTKEGRG